jgi:hypothetical protein
MAERRVPYLPPRASTEFSRPISTKLGMYRKLCGPLPVFIVPASGVFHRTGPQARCSMSWTGNWISSPTRAPSIGPVTPWRYPRQTRLSFNDRSPPAQNAANVAHRRSGGIRRGYFNWRHRSALLICPSAYSISIWRSVRPDWGSGAKAD